MPVAINTGLTGIPYWGTDIGGFVPTKELTGELYVRWFQFGAFCPLFRSHGRTWKLRLPWGWNTGELGPNEIRTYGDAANPDPSELHNAAVEPICRKYLELRYRLMPYLYSVVREGCQTGLPIIRALWLHYRDDPTAVARGDEYLWGPNILVAPVTEKGATTRRHLPAPRASGTTSGPASRSRAAARSTGAVDLATMPLVRPGRDDPAAGPGQAIHRRSGRRPADASGLSRRRRPLPGSTRMTASRSPIARATGWASTCAGTTRPGGCRSASPTARGCARRSSARSRCELMPDGKRHVRLVFTGQTLEVNLVGQASA